MVGIRDQAEIRPYRAVEEMFLNGSDNLGDTDNGKSMFMLSDNDIVCKKWDCPYMVKVGMGDKDILDLQLGFFIKDTRDCSGIKQEIRIQEKTRDIMSGEFGT